MIKSKDLLNIIQETLGKEEFSQQDLETIEDLSVKRYKLNGKITDIDLEELKIVKNLRTLSLSNFAINSNHLEYINENNNLWAIQFSSCFFEDVIPLSENIKYLILDNCKNLNFDLINNNETIKIIGIKIDLKHIKKFTNIKTLYLQDCEIDNIEEIKNYKQLKYLNLDGSKINNLNFIMKLSDEIQISYKEDYHPMEEN